MARSRLVVLAACVLLVAASSVAQDGRFIIRARGLGVFPDDDGETVAGSAARLAVAPTVGGELTAVYLLTPSWDVELAAAAFPLDLSTEGDPEIEVGSATAALATLTLHYRLPTRGRLRPYLGLGITMATLSSFEADRELEELGFTSVEFSDSLRLGTQLGVDILLGKGWIASLALSYMPATTRADLVLPTGATFDSVALEINPLVLAVGFGRAF